MKNPAMPIYHKIFAKKGCVFRVILTKRIDIIAMIPTKKNIHEVVVSRH
ncbi:MAG: hypothetical protein WCI77_08755 [Candidatus Omnitrophota bacterium]